MMEDYDVLFAVVLRMSDTNGMNMEKKMDKATKKLGSCISDVYRDCAVLPVGFEKVNEDEFLGILNHFEFREDNDVSE